MEIRHKDFIETAERLIFAVLVDGTEQNRVLCFLRYLGTEHGFRKVDTENANRVVAVDFPQYRFHSSQRDADVHGVPLEKILRHYHPVRKLEEIIRAGRRDPVQSKLVSTIELLQNSGVPLDCVGVTGSLLIGAQTGDSDIDLVIYGQENFQRARDIVRQSFRDHALDPLSEAQWKEAYRRRGCSLSFAEYFWHERRKYNKASLAGTKIDFSLVPDDSAHQGGLHRKIESAEIIARVTDGRYGFDHPARYPVSHPEIREILSFTPTFAGQAFAGETVTARGMIEQAECGPLRLIIGSSREAPGEFIKVVRSAA